MVAAGACPGAGSTGRPVLPASGAGAQTKGRSTSGTSIPTVGGLLLALEWRTLLRCAAG